MGRFSHKEYCGMFGLLLLNIVAEVQELFGVIKTRKCGLWSWTHELLPGVRNDEKDDLALLVIVDEPNDCQLECGIRYFLDMG